MAPAVTALQALMERRGARLDALADGSLLTVLASKSVASDLAAQAAQCALALRAALPGRPLALTTGRAEVGTVLAGDTIDRAARLLDAGRASAGSAGIVLDEVTAGLLGCSLRGARPGRPPRACSASSSSTKSRARFSEKPRPASAAIARSPRSRRPSRNASRSPSRAPCS